LVSVVVARGVRGVESPGEKCTTPSQGRPSNSSAMWAHCLLQDFSLLIHSVVNGAIRSNERLACVSACKSTASSCECLVPAWRSTSMCVLILLMKLPPAIRLLACCYSLRSTDSQQRTAVAYHASSTTLILLHAFRSG